jgi:small subunit ribosomal protein S17
MAEEEQNVTNEAPDADQTSAADASEPVEEAKAQVVAPKAAAPSEPQLPPKERRAKARAAKAAATPTRKPRTGEERQAEREGERGRKAVARRREREQARAKYKAAEHERVATAPREHDVGNQKTRQGIVVSDKADKTITVRIDVARRHRRYSKIVRTSSTVHAHDESNDAHTGDTVVVRESRPLSRSKRWRLVEVVERAK